MKTVFTRNQKNGLIYYTSDLLTKNGFIHGFFTRVGGVSKGDFASLNISHARKDHDGNTDSTDNIFENYSRALNVLGTSVHRAVGTTQVHENTVLRVSDDYAGHGINPLLPPLSGCDGLIIDQSSENVDAVIVKTADCVPVLLADKNTGNVSAVHAGWRGTVADIVTVTAKKMDCNPQDLLCALGPCINVCCYEVGEEVKDAVKKLFSSKDMEDKTDSMFRQGCVCSMKPTLHADLPLINKTLLMKFGVPEENIDLSDICTCCGGDEFFSHRKSGGFSGTFPSAILKRRSHG